MEISSEAEGVAVCKTGLLIWGRPPPSAGGNVDDFDMFVLVAAASAKEVGKVLVLVI